MKNIKLIIAASAFLIWGSCGLNKSSDSESNNEQTNNKNAETEWVTLFNGIDLTGWKILGSEEADFQVRNGILIGNTVKGIPNSFLVTEKNYDDFILELEFKIDSGINSGVQIRSGVYDQEVTTNYLNGRLEESQKTWQPGRVNGYQVEIDPSERAWSGGFYEEGGRGWLQPLNGNEAARNAYKPEEWNHLKIKAEGNHFQTWINDVKAADYTDERSRSGFIGLQLHSTKKEENIGKKVMFRDIRLMELK